MPAVAPDTLATNLYSIYPEDMTRDTTYDNGLEHNFIAANGILPRFGAKNATYAMDPGNAGGGGFLQNGGLASARMPTLGSWTGVHLGFNESGAMFPPFMYSFHGGSMDGRTLTVYAVVNKCCSGRVTDGNGPNSDTGVDEVLFSFGHAGGADYGAIAVDHVTGCILIKITSGATYNTGIPSIVNNHGLVISFTGSSITVKDHLGHSYTSAAGISSSATDVNLLYWCRAFATDTGWWRGAIKYLAVNVGASDSASDHANALAWMVANYDCRTSYDSVCIIDGDSNMCAVGTPGAHSYALGRAMLQPQVAFIIKAWRGLHCWQLNYTRAQAMVSNLGLLAQRPIDIEFNGGTNDMWFPAAESSSLYSTYSATAARGGGAYPGDFSSNMMAKCLPLYIKNYAADLRSLGVRLVLVGTVLPASYMDYPAEILSITRTGTTARVITKLPHNYSGTSVVLWVLGTGLAEYNGQKTASVSASVSAISGNGTVISITTSAAHGILASQSVTISGGTGTSAGYNGTYTVASVPDSTHLTVVGSATGALAGTILVTPADSFTYTVSGTPANVADTGKVAKFNTLFGSLAQEISREDGSDAGAHNGIPTLNNGRQQTNALILSYSVGLFTVINHDKTHFMPKVPNGGTVGDWVVWQMRNTEIFRRTRLNQFTGTQDSSTSTKQTAINAAIGTDQQGHYDGLHRGKSLPLAATAAVTHQQAIASLPSNTKLRNRNFSA